MASSSSNRDPKRPVSGDPLPLTESRRVRVRRKVSRSSTGPNYFLMFWRREKWFRLALAVSLLLGVGTVALALTQWTTSPSGTSPEIRVRILRIITSWNFERSANQATRAGRNDLAVRAWKEAIANNPGNLRAIRGFLSSVNELPQVNQQTVALSIYEANRLLAMTRTNAADLDLVATFYGKYDVYDLALWHLNSTNVPVTPAISLALVKALYETAQVNRLMEVWKVRGDSLTNNQEAQLYRVAALAAWGSELEQKENREKLKTASAALPQGSPLKLTSLRLLLRTAFLRIDRTEYERRLAELTDLHGDELADHLRHILLLEATGLRSEALRLAKENIAVPATIADAELQITVWGRLGMASEAASFSQNQMPRLGYPSRLCVSLVPMLFNSRSWDEFRPLAVGIRQASGLSSIYGGYSYFLEGLAELGLSNRRGAEELFERYARDPSQDANLILSAAALLSRNGFGFSAAKLLKSVEPSRGGSAEFWKEMQAAAYSAKDANLLFSACERLYRLKPEDPVAANNYAASLLILREQAPEAVRITLEVMNALPTSFSAVVNHAVALCQVGRPADAGELIKDADPDQYNPDDRASLLFAKFQYFAGLGKFTEAKNIEHRLDRTMLFPPQIEWLNKTLAGFPK